MKHKKARGEVRGVKKISLLLIVFAVVLTFLATYRPVFAITGDVSGSTLGVPDGKVNMYDIGYIASYLGRLVQPAGPAPLSCDLNGDGKINMIDIAMCATHWTGV